MSAPPPPPRGGMSLYANLLESDSSASISRDPVVFTKEDNAPAKKHIDPALRFQPIRRPQAKQPTKPKPAAFPKAIPPSTSTDSSDAPKPARATLADWAAAADDDCLYEKKKLQRGGARNKKKRKKAGENDQQQHETNWDDIYDPARPTNVDEYLRSDERIRELREWKGVLYAHRRGRESSGSDDDDDEDRRAGMGHQFAPPASLTFAPPPFSPPRPAANADAATGDDAYARRLALSSGAAPPPPTEPTTISRAPVRYEPPPPPPPPPAEDMDLDDPSPGPATRRPGQPDFAARLMAKYGWTRGSGLGASSSGITTALRVHVEKKRRRRPDSEGGGFVDGPGGRGRIIPSKTGQPATSTTPGVGKASTVVLLGGMLEGMADVEGEVEAGLGQEIGEECGERYGRVERVVVDAAGGGVYIKFVEGVSALRAVSALEGRVFNGNVIVPRFYDEEKFEGGEYA
ncbi:hypothetical protein QBC39DRAFT_367977 [Podospora conica]|nr:hypothetical protein QBC39DRAFT_367977 [Schizothecium conicum]